MNESNQASCDLVLRVVRYAPRQTMELHQHAEASIGVIVGGDVAETVNGQTTIQSTGALVAKPPGVPHRDQFGARGAVMLSIRNLIRDAYPKQWCWVQTPGVGRHAIAIVAELERGDPFGTAQESAWSLLQAISSADCTPRSHLPPPWLARIRDEVAAVEARPSVAKLAGSVGVHPVYLTRLFRKHYGCSLSGFFRRRRVERAADSLIGTPEVLAAIAAGHGFSDQSHFCRIFKSEMGVSPNMYRSLISRAGVRCV